MVSPRAIRLVLAFLVALPFVVATRKSLERRIIDRITHIYGSLPAGSTPTALTARCTACKQALHFSQQLLALPDGASTLAGALQTHCDGTGPFSQSRLCQVPHHQAMTFIMHKYDNYGNHSSSQEPKIYNRETIHKRQRDHAITGLYNDATNVISLMDPGSLDGDLFCHYLLLGSCPLPTGLDDQVDLSHWWPPKPENAVEPPPSGRTFRVLHLSDIHFQPGYAEGAEAECGNSMCCRDGALPHMGHMGTRGRPSMPAPPMGYYRCDTPERLVRSSLGHVMQTGRDARPAGAGKAFEFAIFTGDMVDHDPLFISYEKSVQEEIETMTYLKRYLGDIPVYAVLGNHDTYPFAQVAQESSGFGNLFTWNADLMAQMWEEYDWLDTAAAQQVREHYGGFATITRQGLRIISLNSNFWYIYNLYNYWNVASTDPRTGKLRYEDTSGVLKFLVDELLKCEQRGQRAWVIAHIPPNGDDTLAIPAAMLTQIVERFSPHVVAGLFFGHTHQDQFQLLYGGSRGYGHEKWQEQALNVAWIGPSITPLTDFNPGWRYYDVDAETFGVVDSHNFYARLNDSFDEGRDELDWRHLYSARAAYDPDQTWPEAAPLNATFWHRVAAHMGAKDGGGGELTQQFLDYGFRNSPYRPSCLGNEACRIENYCYVSSFNPDQARRCMSEGGSRYER